MASLGNWTVVFEDKIIIKQNGDSAGPCVINDDAFWNQSKFSNIWAIHHGTSSSTDEVEYKDTTPHSVYDSSVLGDFSQFTNKWDSTHLSNIQAEWDENIVDSETSAEKIARLGARPASYSS
tara:strand:+ start:364 stop:729 length:366 start_codon:yes stop_codon:yes gene_type:complete